MTIKYIPISGYDFGVAPVQPVRLSSRGLRGHDRAEFLKVAGHWSVDRIKSIKIPRGVEPVLVLAVNSTERLGPNRNGDGFRVAACRKYHPTFVSHARFYRDHQSRDPHKNYGRILDSFFNEAMQRIETIVGLNGTEAAAREQDGLVADQELDILNSGSDFPASMGCFTDPNYPILTRDSGYVRIEDIRVGDFVWTNKSRWQRVYQLNRRIYTGELYRFEINGLPLPLEVTSHHPMWAKIFDGHIKENVKPSTRTARTKRFFRDTEAFEKNPPDWFEASHVKIGDRFFYRPLLRYPGYSQIGCEKTAAILGYYLAEGSLSYNGDKACTIRFDCNYDDSAVRRLPKLIEDVLPGMAVQLKPHPRSAKGVTLFVHNTAFAEFVRLLIGARCLDKTIPPEIFNAGREVKLAYLGAWLDGDGWGDKKGAHWSTANINLALQGRDLLASIGIPSSIYRIDHGNCATSGKFGPDTIEYTLNVSSLDCESLNEYSEKMASWGFTDQERKMPSSMRLCGDGSYAYRIRNVTKRFVENVQTFNFEVEEDESYSAAGLISHNCNVDFDSCSGCGNKARNRSEYCDESTCPYGGLKRFMGRVFDDGHILHADNPHPTWFDLSHITKGRQADRSAYSLARLSPKVEVEIIAA